MGRTESPRGDRKGRTSSAAYKKMTNYPHQMPQGDRKGLHPPQPHSRPYDE